MRQDDPVLSAWKTFTLTMTMTLTILRLLFGMPGPEVSHSCNVLYLSGCIFVFPWVYLIQACCKFRGGNEEGGGAHQEEADILNREGGCLNIFPALYLYLWLHLFFCISICICICSRKRRIFSTVEGVVWIGREITNLCLIVTQPAGSWMNWKRDYTSLINILFWCGLGNCNLQNLYHIGELIVFQPGVVCIESEVIWGLCYLYVYKIRETSFI